MRRPVVLLVLALAVPALPLAAAAPASAATAVICVGLPAGPCTTAPTLTAALNTASSDGVPDIIDLGAGPFTDGPWTAAGGDGGLTIQGLGSASTTLTMASSPSTQTYLDASFGVVLGGFTIQMTGGVDSQGDRGLLLAGSAVDDVSVTGLTTTNATGIQIGTSTLTNSSALMDPTGASGTTGLYSAGSNTMSDLTLSGGTAYNFSDPNSTDHASRLSMLTDSTGVRTDGGTIDLDNSLVDLDGGGAGAVGLCACNGNPSPFDKAINADHVTIANGGSGSLGAKVTAANDTVVQTSTLTLTNSVVTGVTNGLEADAGNLCGACGTSVATLVATHSDFANVVTNVTANGSAPGDRTTGDLTADPQLLSPGTGNFRLATTSPVIDKGDPAFVATGPDLAGASRVQDGDNDGVPVNDMGAYELPDTVAPNTFVTSGPSTPTASRTATFTFTSEPNATFRCRLDGGAFTPCTSPFTTGPLADGFHAFAVRAVDVDGNADATPSTGSWKVDTTAPQTTVPSRPGHKITKRKAKFYFVSTEPRSTFRCRLDHGRFLPCTAPAKYKVKVGKHVFRVYAIDDVGNVDPTPAVVKFKRIKVKHH